MIANVWLFNIERKAPTHGCLEAFKLHIFPHARFMIYRSR